MRYWKSPQPEHLLAVLACLSLAACAAEPGDAARLAIDQASIITRGATTELLASVDFQPSVRQLQAMEHGVPLVLRVRAFASDGSDAVETRLSLRYFALSRRYQLRTETSDIEAGGIDRSFALRGYLLDALQRLRLPLSHNPCAEAEHCTLKIGMDYTELPGALRLPALIKPEWRVADATYKFAVELP